MNSDFQLQPLKQFRQDPALLRRLLRAKDKLDAVSHEGVVTLTGLQLPA